MISRGRVTIWMVEMDGKWAWRGCLQENIVKSNIRPGEGNYAIFDLMIKAQAASFAGSRNAGLKSCMTFEVSTH